jgi:predicted dehydrogenase
MGRGHCARVGTEVTELQLAAVCDAHAPTAEAAGREFGVPHFTAHRKLIASGLCDAVIVATPHPLHPAATIDAVRAGLHVLTEKPLSEDIYTAERMVQAADAAGRVLGVMFQSRFLPVARKAMELIRSGAIGEITRATLIAPDYRSQAYYDAGNWRATWTGEGGGVLINQAPHITDLFVMLAGLPETVIGATRTRLHHIEVEDQAQALLTFAGGGSGYIYCTTNEPQPGLAIEIAGDRGKLFLRDFTLRYFRYTAPVRQFTHENTEMWGKVQAEEVPVEVPPGDATHADVMRNFARHILYGEELLCSGRSALGQLELANAIVLSSYLQRPVTLPINRLAYHRLLGRLRKASLVQKQVEEKRITDPAFLR